CSARACAGTRAWPAGSPTAATRSPCTAGPTTAPGCPRPGRDARDLRGGGTVLLHDSDRTAPGCWRSALGALSGLVGECRAAGWTVGRLAEHWSGASRPPPFVPEFYAERG